MGEVSQGRRQQSYILKEESAFFGGKRKEKGIQRRGNNKSHELLSRPGTLGEMKESLIEWMAGKGAK